MSSKIASTKNMCVCVFIFSPTWERKIGQIINVADNVYLITHVNLKISIFR